jgi:hypothetical protein
MPLTRINHRIDTAETIIIAVLFLWFIREIVASKSLAYLTMLQEELFIGGDGRVPAIIIVV